MGSLGPPSRIRVAIAGGGIAGLCLARGLSQYDHLDIQVYEATPEYRDVGAGMALHRNAIRAMELIDPVLKNAYSRKAHSMAADEEQELATQVSMAHGKHEGEVIAELGRAKGRKSVARKDLLEGYRDLVDPERLHLGKRLVKIEGESPVILLFQDGTSTSADCVIGADGIHSCTRKYILDDHPSAEAVNHDRWYRFGRSVPVEEARGVLPNMTEYVQILCGPGPCFNVMPIDYGKTISLSMALMAGRDEDIGKFPDRSALLGYNDQCLAVYDLIARDIRPENIWIIMDHDPAPFYAKGIVATIGDAAHATGPFIGNGAAQAIEDAAVLHALFAHVHDTSQVAAALIAFDEVRRPRSQRVNELGRQMGRFYAHRFGDNWTADSDIEDLRDRCKTIASYTNDADIALQNEEAVAAFQRIDSCAESLNLTKTAKVSEEGSKTTALVALATGVMLQESQE